MTPFEFSQVVEVAVLTRNWRVSNSRLTKSLDYILISLCYLRKKGETREGPVINLARSEPMCVHELDPFFIYMTMY